MACTTVAPDKRNKKRIQMCSKCQNKVALILPYSVLAVKTVCTGAYCQ